MKLTFFDSTGNVLSSFFENPEPKITLQSSNFINDVQRSRNSRNTVGLASRRIYNGNTALFEINPS